MAQSFSHVATAANGLTTLGVVDDVRVKLGTTGMALDVRQCPKPPKCPAVETGAAPSTGARYWACPIWIMRDLAHQVDKALAAGPPMSDLSIRVSQPGAHSIALERESQGRGRVCLSEENETLDGIRLLECVQVLVLVAHDVEVAVGEEYRAVLLTVMDRVVVVGILRVYMLVTVEPKGSPIQLHADERASPSE
ncbi:uncharacterized protein B0I36DRAFT_354394 [Microdochium trichocladiopsis]|uniref:Uncharacterized protein n=1 Tax=Microdochium trichocladiopsis TaxID=1682393 RepID=A0A9P9BJE9_9PEZI|nr:uncharacterized protein B0I36DRAFT_354394 [Microdochium trichocladiopsis]KAH7018078.1 hypothetical protein B0I36DRAFT_354394 [Microdochium trichocladiopsis]